MKIKTLAHQVADDLFAFENAIDTALGMAGKLSESLTSARIEGNVSAVVGQDAFDGLSEAVAALTAARRGAVQAHQGLDAAKNRLGLRTVALGGLIKPPALSTVQDAA